MKAEALLNYVSSRDVSVSVKDGSLVVKGHNHDVAEVTSLLRQHKGELIALLSSKPNGNDLKHFYEERASIYQFDSNFIKEEAERWAFQDALTSYVREHHPTIYAQVEKLTSDVIH
ncbi:MAG: hypothetical protein EB060_01730 [Proteobacteria bacterium]|nr:hypothetical protein [Pseudomonadota bacterium]